MVFVVVAVAVLGSDDSGPAATEETNPADPGQIEATEESGEAEELPEETEPEPEPTASATAEDAAGGASPEASASAKAAPTPVPVFRPQPPKPKPEEPEEPEGPMPEIRSPFED